MKRMNHKQDLEQRIEAYAQVVGEFNDLGINYSRQMKGDLKEIKARCEIHNLDYAVHKRQYVDSCKKYLRTKNI